MTTRRFAVRARSGPVVAVTCAALAVAGVAACSPTVSGNGQAGVTVIRGGIPTVVTTTTAPQYPAPSDASSTAPSSSASASSSASSGVTAIPESGGSYTFVQTKSGRTQCKVSRSSAGCQLSFDKPGPRTESGDPANGVNVSSDGTLTYVLGDIGVSSPVTLQYSKYSARGWTIVATAKGTTFTNDATGHGMEVSTEGAQAF